MAYFNEFGEIEQWDLHKSGNFDFIIVQFKRLHRINSFWEKRYHRIQNHIVSVAVMNDMSIKSMNQNISFVHMLNLNNMLLSRIFDYLPIEDLTSVAETCKLFKQLSEQCFLSKFDKITLRSRDTSASKIFLIFGHLITDLDVDLTEPLNMSLNFIADICGAKLRRLSFWMFDKEDSHLDNDTKKKVMRMFSHLKHLEIYCQQFFDMNTAVDLLSSCLSIESLSINCTSTVNTVWNEIHICLPQLKELRFQLNLAINDIGLRNWLASNPNIKILYIDECTNLSPYAINIIVNYLRGLEELTLGLLQHSPKENLEQLGHLPCFSSLGVVLDEALPLMNIVYEASIPITSLDLWFVSVKNSHINRISSIKTIRELTIYSYSTEDHHLEMIAVSLPLLNKLTLAHSEHVTIDGLKFMIHHAKYLMHLHLIAMKKIDQNEQRRFVEFCMLTSLVKIVFE